MHGANQHGEGWTYDGKDLVPPALQAEFLSWLVNPDRQPTTQRQWAKDHDVHESTLGRWKRDPSFREMWERQLAELNIDPGRIQDVIESLWRVAKNGDVKAMVAYLQMVEKISPPKIVIEEKSVQDMGDDELAAALRERAEKMAHK